MKMKTGITLCIFIIFIGLILSCKTIKPAEGIKPESVLIFEKIEAPDPGTLYLDYKLDVYNPVSKDAELIFQETELVIHGLSVDKSLFSIEFPENIKLLKHERRSESLRLTFNASEYEKRYHPAFDEYELALAMAVQYAYSNGTADTTAETLVVFPRVREPEFKITQIKIMQAELINTRFKVHLQVDNPNYFPVELISFNYELFGDGRFWAEGEEKHVLRIPAKDKAEIDLFLLMNFTNMRRNVLDQIIALTQVRYRFKGSARVETGIGYLPRFVMDFEREGHSEVIR